MSTDNWLWVVGAMGTTIIAMVGYFVNTVTKAQADMLRMIDRIDDTQNATVKDLGVVTERLTNHLEWASENFTPQGDRRPRR